MRAWIDRLWTWWFTPVGMMLASMFAGEYIKPARMIDRFIDRVRRGL